MPLTLTATDTTTGTYVKEEAESFFGRAIDGASQMVLPNEDKALTSKEGFAGAVLVGSVSAIASGMYTRKRATRGEPAIAKFLF